MSDQPNNPLDLPDPPTGEPSGSGYEAPSYGTPSAGSSGYDAPSPGSSSASGSAYSNPSYGSAYSSPSYGNSPAPMAGGSTGEGSPQPSPLVAGTDYTSSFTNAEITEGKTVGILGYIGILFLIPMLAQPKNGYSKFHANQGLVLFGGGFVLYLAVIILSAIISVLGFLMPLVSIAWLVFMIIGIINAANGRAKTLPLLGSISILK